MKKFMLASQVTGFILITLFLFGGLLNSYGMDIKPIWFVGASTPLLLLVWLVLHIFTPSNKGEEEK